MQYNRVYSDERNYIFVRCLDKARVERASTMKARSVNITPIEVPNPKNLPEPLDIIFAKLIPDAYAFMPNYSTLNKKISNFQLSNARQLSELKEEWKKVEKVELTKELDRTDIFFKELDGKIDKDLKVVREYGTLGNDSNCYSLCGTSRIDIVLSNKKAKIKNDTYIAGAVMEMKTHRLRTDNEAQTAYEMMKFGTDQFIKHMLKQGNVKVNKVVVFGILVDMELSAGLVMQLEMDLSKGTATCTRNRRDTVPMRSAFQLIRETLL